MDYLTSAQVLQILSEQKPDVFFAPERWLRAGLFSGAVLCRASVAVLTDDWDKSRPVRNWEIKAAEWGDPSDRFSLRADRFRYYAKGHDVECTGLMFDARLFYEYAELTVFSGATPLECPPSLEPAPQVDEGLRGTLPANRTPADLKHEAYAHKAAGLVRQGMKLSEAARKVAPVDPTRLESSIEFAIRRTFSKMYDQNGRPL